MRLILNSKKQRLGTRHTREREMILDRVQNMPGHFGAEELLLSLARQGARASRATVYRTLDLLVAEGVLQRVSLDQRGARYELVRNRACHAHLYCLDCGGLVDYAFPLLDQLPRRVRKQRGFHAEHMLLRICGYCERCARRRKKGVPFRGRPIRK